MKTGDMKVYSGQEAVEGKQVSVIVAATSQRTAVAALWNFGIGISVRHLTTYWSITTNRKQCETALAVPGQAFASSSPDTEDYAPLPRRVRSQHEPKTLKELKEKAPKVPKDKEGRREYDREKRGDSDAAKRARGERRVTTWLPKEAAEALDALTAGSTERGAVQAVLSQALLEMAERQAVQKAA